jgi:hypothetical protein
MVNPLSSVNLELLIAILLKIRIFHWIIGVTEGLQKKTYTAPQENLAQVPPVDMRPLEYYSSLTQIKPGCAGTVHDAQ